MSTTDNISDLIDFCRQNLTYVFDIATDNNIAFYPKIGLVGIYFVNYSHSPLWVDIKYDVLSFCELYLIRYGCSISLKFAQSDFFITNDITINDIADIDFVISDEYKKLASIRLPHVSVLK